MSGNIKNQKSIAGLRANAAALLVNLSYFLPGIGLIVPIVTLILEEDNDFVRSYAKQTLALSVFTVASASLNLIFLVGSALFGVLMLLLVVVQVVAAVSSFLEKEFKIPYLEKVVNLLFID